MCIIRVSRVHDTWIIVQYICTMGGLQVHHTCIMCASWFSTYAPWVHHRCIMCASYVNHVVLHVNHTYMYHGCTTCAPHTHQPKPTGGSRSHPRLPVACMQRWSADTAAARRQREDSATTPSLATLATALRHGRAEVRPWEVCLHRLHDQLSAVCQGKCLMEYLLLLYDWFYF